jgi:hypothetical protein
MLIGVGNVDMNRQQGASYWEFVIVYGLIALFCARLFIVIVPIYQKYYQMDNFITNLIVQVYNDNATKKQQLRDSLEANMKLRQITDRTIDDLMTITSEGNRLTIDLDYEERQHLCFNLDIVIHFKKIYTSEQNTIYGDDD